MTEWVEQWFCIKNCIKLKHSTVEIIQMIQKATAMDYWWLAASSWLCTCSCITSGAQFLAKQQIDTGDSAPYSPDLAPCDFWLFPKLKSPLKRKIFQTIEEIQENTTRQLMMIGRTMRGPEVPILKETAEEKHQWAGDTTIGCLSYAPNRALAHNPGMCPDWESNWQPFGSQASAQSTEPQHSGPLQYFKFHWL